MSIHRELEESVETNGEPCESGWSIRGERLEYHRKACEHRHMCRRAGAEREIHTMAADMDSSLCFG